MMIHVRVVLLRIGHDVHDSSELGNRPEQRWPEPLVVCLCTIMMTPQESGPGYSVSACSGHRKATYIAASTLRIQQPHSSVLLILSWRSTSDTALHFPLADEHAPGGISSPIAMLHY